MCYRLFIASDHPLPPVPVGDPPVFAAFPLAGPSTLRLPFPPGWNVVEAGSSSGCACDFHDGARSGDEPPGASIMALAGYLRSLAAGQSVSIYSTWYGEEPDPSILQPGLTPDEVVAATCDPFPSQTLTPIILT
jgi:hypothetical protein